MQRKRRTLIAAIAASTVVAGKANAEGIKETNTMYGLIGKIKIKTGQRDALARILLQATRSMPGCISYVIAADPNDGDALWITEVWDSAESHKASLKLPAVQAALQLGRPLIAGFGERFETQPIGGYGPHFTEGH